MRWDRPPLKGAGNPTEQSPSDRVADPTLVDADLPTQLNAYKPIILHNVLESAELLSEGCRSFAERCVVGIEANERCIREHLEQSLMLVTALSPHIGYDKSAKIAHYAHHEDLSLREAALKLGYVTEAEFDAWVRPEAMTGPSG